MHDFLGLTTFSMMIDVNLAANRNEDHDFSGLRIRSLS